MKNFNSMFLTLTSQPVSNQKFNIGEKDWLKHVVSQSFVLNFFFFCKIWNSSVKLGKCFLVVNIIVVYFLSVLSYWFFITKYILMNAYLEHPFSMQRSCFGQKLGIESLMVFTFSDSSSIFLISRSKSRITSP